MITGLLKGVMSVASSGLFKNMTDTVKEYLPPSMSDTEKQDFELKFQELANQTQLKLNDQVNEASEILNARIAQQEGTASDLMKIPLLGALMLFLRGCQRPVWSMATMWMDFQWFFGGMVMTERQEMALIVINVLVLGFLFGERAVKNLQPLIEKVFTK